MTSNDVIRLRLLGVPRLEGPGRELAGVLSQPKRLALLSFLATRPGWVRRQDLLRFFWADVPEDRGRRALSQGLHFLRQAVGTEAIRARGVEEVSISREAVWCDVLEFEAAISRRRWQDALTLYRGELLQGVTPEASADFSHWLDGERNRLRHTAGQAAAKQADACFRAGDVMAAVRWQQRAHSIDPVDESILREYLILLDEAGDAATALSAYESFRQRLTSEFDLDPARETVRIVEMIRDRRPESESILPTAMIDADRVEDSAPAASGATAAPPATDNAAVPLPVTRRRWTRWLPSGGPHLSQRRAAIAAFLILLFGSGAWAKLGTAAGARSPFPAEAIAVPYIEVTGNAEDLRPIANYLSERLAAELSEYDTLQVISPAGMRRFRNADVDPNVMRDELRVGTIVWASLSRIGDRTSLNVQVTSTDTWALQRGETFGFDGEPVLEMLDSATTLVSRALRGVIGEEVRRRERRRGTSSDVAVRLVANASEIDRDFHSIANSGGTEGAKQAVESADALLVQAIDQDRQWVEPWVIRGQLAWSMAYQCTESDDCPAEPWLARSAQYAETALDMEPSNPDALELRGVVRHNTYMFGIDDNPKLLDDAVQDLRAALSSNRRRATTLSALADALFTRGDFRQANETAREAWHADAFLLRPHILMRRFESAFHLEDDVQAAAVCAEEKAMLPRTMWLFCELALRGWSQDRKPDADGAWELVEDLYGSPSTPGTAAARAIPELQIAAILARAGEADSARNVVRRVRGRASYDREADLFAAAALARIGDHVDACAIVSTWLERVPTSRASLSRMRWFRDLPVVANSLVANEGAPPDPRP